MGKHIFLSEKHIFLILISLHYPYGQSFLTELTIEIINKFINKMVNFREIVT